MAHQKQNSEVGFQTVTLLREKTLGVGSYGSVFKAVCDNLTCAAKIIHPTLVPMETGYNISVRKEHRLPINRFTTECEFLKEIRHPNIVQYLGIYQDPETGLPVLLMELMDESLTHFLENSTAPILYHIQLDISLDITRALSFLHLNGIVHRDLSSNNILLTGKSRAKLTDFGMAKLVKSSANNSIVSNTLCPGTDAYMPPEAIDHEAVFTEKGDVFSFGVNIIQMLTRKFPKPGDRFKELQIDHPQVPTGKVEVRASELDRRQDHISRIDPSHPLLSIALDCLKDLKDDRPSTSEIYQRLTALKSVTKADISKEDGKEDNLKTRELQQQLQLQQQTYDKQIQLLQQEIEIKEQEITVLKEECSKQQKAMEDKDETIAANISKIARDKQVITQLHRSLKDLKNLQRNDFTSEQQVECPPSKQLTDPCTPLVRPLQPAGILHVTPPTVPPRTSSQRQLQKSAHYTQTEPRIQKPTKSAYQSTPKPRLRLPSIDKECIAFEWARGKNAPCVMHRDTDAVVNGNTVYFRPYRTRKVYSFNSQAKLWSRLPDCSTDYSALTIIDESLTTVGGTNSNQLFSLTRGEGGKSMWTEEYPCMKTERSRCSVVCTESILVVAGGMGKGQAGTQVLKSVEVMNTEIRQWSTAADMLEPLCASSIQLLGNCIYMFGGMNQSFKETKMAYSCTIADLIMSCRSSAFLAKISSLKMTLSRTRSIVWTSLAHLPVSSATSVICLGHLLAIGGRDADNIPTATVHRYDPTNNLWQYVGDLNNPRSLCFAAGLPNNTVMTVGGIAPPSSLGSVSTDTVDIIKFE